MIINSKVVELFRYISSQTEERKVSSYKGSLTSRYGYGRARKTAMQGKAGHDFLGIHIDGDTCNFAVCHGIGQDNQGGLASRYLGNHLLTWLDSTKDWSSIGFLSYMENLSSIATQELNNHEAFSENEDTTGKGKLNSNSMYICGRIEIPTEKQPVGRIWMSWQGSSRLRYLRDGLELSQYFKGTIHNEEWWSISEGLVGGNPHVYQSRLEYGVPMRLQVYTEGLHDLDPILERLPDEQVQILFNAPHTGGLKNDAVFLELEW